MPIRIMTEGQTDNTPLYTVKCTVYSYWGRISVQSVPILINKKCSHITCNKLCPESFNIYKVNRNRQSRVP